MDLCHVGLLHGTTQWFIIYIDGEKGFVMTVLRKAAEIQPSDAAPCQTMS